MSKTATIPMTEYLSKMRGQAESIRNDQPIEFSVAASAGDYIRQGDVYVTLCDEVPAGFTKRELKDLGKNPAQVAIGNTQGSRHIWDSLEGVEIYKNDRANELQGCVYVLSQTRTLTHPEHGDVICTVPEGETRIFNITYQRAYAEEIKRVRD